MADTVAALDAQPFRFLDLPTEIRLEIYEYLTVRHKHYPIADMSNQPPRPDTQPLSLVIGSLPGVGILATCHQIRGEASFVLKARLYMLKRAPIKIIADYSIFGDDDHPGMVYLVPRGYHKHLSSCNALTAIINHFLNAGPRCPGLELCGTESTKEQLMMHHRAHHIIHTIIERTSSEHFQIALAVKFTKDYGSENEKRAAMEDLADRYLFFVYWENHIGALDNSWSNFVLPLERSERRVEMTVQMAPLPASLADAYNTVRPFWWDFEDILKPRDSEPQVQVIDDDLISDEVWQAEWEEDVDM